ncbi:MAG: ParA family protein [Bryobacteraceae bacterium]
MIRLTISNQRGGVGKTTTTLTLARSLAEQGKRVLVIDTDSQGSVYLALGLAPAGWLHQFVNDGLSITRVATKVHDRIDVICSDRRSMRVEVALGAATAKEMTFYSLLSCAEQRYDAILFDVAPSISHLQSCAIAYTKNVVVPVAMDALSIEGARSSLQTIEVLNHFLRLGCRCVGFLPTMVDYRLSPTDLVLSALKSQSESSGIAVLHAIRTDQAVNKALRKRKFLHDFDRRSKALEDYETACKEILRLLAHQDGQTQAIAAR